MFLRRYILSKFIFCHLNIKTNLLLSIGLHGLSENQFKMEILNSDGSVYGDQKFVRSGNDSINFLNYIIINFLFYYFTISLYKAYLASLVQEV